MDTIYPKYKDFSRLVDEKNELKRPISKFERVARYILTCIGITLLCGVIVFAIALMRGSTDGGSRRRDYPSSKYRKVVKERLFWDDVEYHER